MQGNGGGSRDPFFGFGDPFAGFGGFGGFGGQRSLLSSFFGGRDPFDDPFFRQPFGGMQPSFFGEHPFANMQPTGFLEQRATEPFANMQPTGFLEQRAPEPKRSRGPVIEVLNSDDEKETADGEKVENPRKHGRLSNEHYVEVPDDEDEERKRKHFHQLNEYNRFNGAQAQPQTRSFSFQSSSVTYGGVNGAYYTSSKTRRTGSDGVTIEESKEADTSTRKATHRLSRGLHNKGHSLTRKLSSDGNVETMQTLHNLNEDELPGFEAAWRGTARKHLPGWTESFDGHHDLGAGSKGQMRQASQGGWALPSNENSQHSARVIPDVTDKAASSLPESSGRMRADGKGKSSYSQGRTGF